MSDEHPMEDEIKQTYRTLVALLKVSDELAHSGETRDRPIDCYGNIIKMSGELRNELPAEEVPEVKDIDPEEIFNEE